MCMCLRMHMHISITPRHSETKSNPNNPTSPICTLHGLFQNMSRTALGQKLTGAPTCLAEDCGRPRYAPRYIALSNTCFGTVVVQRWFAPLLQFVLHLYRVLMLLHPHNPQYPTCNATCYFSTTKTYYDPMRLSMQFVKPD